ncbi:MAG: SDR family oxidoreductase [Pseudooceanicola sp.]
MKSILITGASSGIGATCADKFLDQGWRVGLLARRADALEGVAKDNPNAMILPADVTDENAVADAFARFAGWAGRIDVLFNNAGAFGRAALIDDLSPDEFRAIVDLNVTGMFLCARAAFAQMRAQDPQGGRIINNGSISAHTPREKSVAYTTTKHAITGLTKTLSLDGRAFGIACGQIDIGNARTPLLDEAVKSGRAGDAPVTMDVAHAADAVLHMAGLPAEANVQFMTIMATTMPYIGRG